MNSRQVIGLVAIVMLSAIAASAADTRTYARSIELVWDDAVKATRDVDLEVTDSDRSEHRFEMERAKTSLKTAVRFEVELSDSGNQTTITVRAIGEEGSKRSVKIIAKYLAALDDRID